MYMFFKQFLPLMEPPFKPLFILFFLPFLDSKHLLPLLPLGLCRTSQIFGLSEVVISNKKVLEETQFQSLSVTAEKWLTVTEVCVCVEVYMCEYFHHPFVLHTFSPPPQVKLPALRDYLLDMQRKGYALVGVEQTAHSKCVTQYKFKHKTLLLLGYVAIFILHK